jgi:hypothetical protein
MNNPYNRDFYTLTTLLMGLIALQVIVKGKGFSLDRPRAPLRHVEASATDSSARAEFRSNKTTSFTKSTSFRVRTFPKVHQASLSGQPDEANTHK